MKSEILLQHLIFVEEYQKNCFIAKSFKVIYYDTLKTNIDVNSCKIYD